MLLKELLESVKAELTTRKQLLAEQDELLNKIADLTGSYKTGVREIINGKADACWDDLFPEADDEAEAAYIEAEARELGMYSRRVDISGDDGRELAQDEAYAEECKANQRPAGARPSNDEDAIHS